MALAKKQKTTSIGSYDQKEITRFRKLLKKIKAKSPEKKSQTKIVIEALEMYDEAMDAK